MLLPKRSLGPGLARLSTLLGAAAAACVLAACGGHAAALPTALTGPADSIAQSLVRGPDTAGPQGKIKHVVIIIQENRSFDSIFHGFKGANYANYGLDSEGKEVKLVPTSFATPGPDICHLYKDAIEDVDGGKMDKFDHCPVKLVPYAYVKSSETSLYFDMAKQYVLADDFFSSQLDASYVGHQYLIAAQAGMAINIPTAEPWGCDANAPTRIQLVNSEGQNTKTVFPCFTYETLATQLDTKKKPWKYYAPGCVSPPSSCSFGYIWSAYDASKAIRNGPDWSTDVVSPQCQVLTDVAAGNLPDVTWVVPDLADSDHLGSGSTTGPQWVASVVNAIGKNTTLWNSTAIFVTWDDWGGYYDHVPPPVVDYDGLGVRVGLIAIGPYAKQGYISHSQYEFASILRSIEGWLGLSTMTNRDKNAASVWGDMFDFTQKPRAFAPFNTGSYSCQPSASLSAPDTE